MGAKIRTILSSFLLFLSEIALLRYKIVFRNRLCYFILIGRLRLLLITAKKLFSKQILRRAFLVGLFRIYRVSGKLRRIIICFISIFITLGGVIWDLVSVFYLINRLYRLKVYFYGYAWQKKGVKII